MAIKSLKYSFVLAVVLFSTKWTIAQDLIVTITGDSIYCRAEKTTDTFVYYVTRKTKRGKFELISRKEVVDVIYNFEDGFLTKGKLKDFSVVQVYGTFTGSRILTGGVRNLSERFDEYISKLKWGSGYTAGVNLFVSKSIGLGVLYSQSNYSNSIDIVQVGTGFRGELSDDFSLKYIAFSLAYRVNIHSSESFILLCGGLGYVSYHNDASTIYAYTLDGSTIGSHLYVSFNLSLGSGIFIPIQFGFKGTSISNFDLKFKESLPKDFEEAILSDIENSEPASYLRLELSVGLLISF